METIEIIGYKRANLGKKESKKLREEGNVPCVVYGGKDQIHFHAPMILFRDLVYTPGANFVKLNIEGEEKDAILQDIQFHPVTEDTLHIDFLRVTDKSYVNVGITVEFINEDKCNGIKFGGVLNVVRSQVELNCPATAIPEKITVDLEGLNVGDTIHISSISLPENCTPTITDRDFTVATIAAPRGGMSDADEEDETTEEQTTEETEEKTEDKKEE